MEILKIKGGTPLQGQIKAAGAKNAMTKLLVASLLSDKTCTFYNVPNILDVEITVNLCREIGSEITWDKSAKILKITTRELKTSYVPQRYSGSNRIPILMIGALLGRTDEDIIVPTIGGDLIGSRPVDLHIHALQKLGAHIEYRIMKKEGAYLAQAHQGLKGAVISLSYPSVGATENTILAAVRAKGTTLIKNAAIEPEIIDLILFLQKLGANIMVDVDRTICIQQAHQFQEVEHTVLADRNEVASYAMAAVSTKGKVFIEGAEHLNMIAFLNKLREIGGGFNVKQNGIEFFYAGSLKGGLHLETDVHPGFMTDWQQPFVVLLTQCQGASVIHETVYENRFGYTHMLKEMGADIELFTQCLGGKQCRFASSNHHHSLVVKGPTPLKAHDFSIPDLRAGFAYVMAALLAPETSTISNVDFLDRGYEDLVAKLTSLGADISRQPLVKKTLPDKSKAALHQMLKKSDTEVLQM
ncbi:MAG: UDP-N-acetylglucosamine 1-carboxyvinyltransferase [Verrucomicrobia bacterium]|nr:UDP-N-acetylglucosamine 1-carboxyvinyltransferase [Verrucomicrobiota bacterium]